MTSRRVRAALRVLVWAGWLVGWGFAVRWAWAWNQATDYEYSTLLGVATLAYFLAPIYVTTRWLDR